MSPDTHKTVRWSDYEQLTTDETPSLVWSSVGTDGAGKTHFALTAPGPIFLAAFDGYGYRRVTSPHPELVNGKDIRVKRYEFSPNKFNVVGTDKKVDVEASKRKAGAFAEALWEQYIEDIRLSLRSGVRTIVVDREDMMWELSRYAEFKGRKAGAQIDGGKGGASFENLNIEWASLIAEVKAANVNFGFLRGYKDKWVAKFDQASGGMKNFNTGERIPDGWNKLHDHVDVVLYHEWNVEQRTYVTKIDKFQNKDERGQEYPELTFPQLAQLAFPDSDPTIWE